STSSPRSFRPNKFVPDSYGELPGQLLWRRHVLQPDIVGEPVFKWRKGFANDERRQIATGGLRDAKTVSADELGRQELFLVGDRRERRLDHVPPIGGIADPPDRGHDRVPSGDREFH